MNLRRSSTSVSLPVIWASITLILLILVGSSCQGFPGQPPAPTPTLTPTLTLQPTPTLTLIKQKPMEWGAWVSGPHATGYDLGRGPNTYCSRCHSPANWDPKATIDPPPKCVSCKFQNESEPRIAVGNPLVPELSWKGLECSVCHRIENGTLIAEPVWHDQVTGYYESVENTTALCEKCHTDTQTLRHKRNLGDQTHVGFLCTDCHDPHSLTASCTQSGCHNNLVSSITSVMPFPHTTMGFSSCSQEFCHIGTNFSTKLASSQQNNIIWNHQDERHDTVSCGACHDASNLEVGVLEGQNIWVTFRTVELLGRSSKEFYQSHNLQKNVNCARCHYAGNPWGLTDSVDWVTEP